MTHQYWGLLAACLLLTSAHSREAKPAAAALSVRAFLHDPCHAAAELYLMDAKGGMSKLNLTPEELGKAQQTIPVDGSFVLFSTAVVDPENPQSAIAASVAVPQNMRRAIAIIVPGPANSKPAYRMVLVDDSAAAFPRGTSKVLTLVAFETAIEAGEHKLPCQPGAITTVAAVTKLDPYNMAQTNFYYNKNGAWIAFNECRMKYLDVFRQVFIVHVRPGGTAPELTTIIDQMPRPTPAK